MSTENKLVYRQETYKIRGAVFEVYREMGCGFLEAAHQECLAREFEQRGIAFVAQNELELFYKGVRLEQFYRPDLICFDKMIVELKAAKEIAPEHQAQLLNYLRASKLRLGLLANFGSHPQVQIKRIVL